MRKSIPYIIFSVFHFLMGCLDPTEVNLYEKGEPEVVIEGRISDLSPPYYVRVSSSVEPLSAINSLPLNLAKVFVSDRSGNTEALQSLGEGLYEANDLQGAVGSIYDIEVQVNNKIFNGTDSIRATPSIDSIKAEYLIETNREEGWYLILYSHKSSNSQKYYKIELSVNDSLYNGYYDLIYFEEILGQKSQTWILPYVFNLNDTVTTSVHSITEMMYEYYRGLSKQVENSFGNIQPPLVNPPNNIPGALGYFQASSIWIDTTIIQ